VFAFSSAKAASDEFEIKPFTGNDFYTFVKVFSEMRGPLRAEILKDRKTDFEKADPLKYVEKVKGKRDVQKVLSDSHLTWEAFRSLMGNILLGYFSIQPDKTKAALLRQLASYGLLMEMDQIPEEYRPIVTDVLKTNEGSTLASAVLDTIIEIPSQNTSIVREHQKDLDRLFYTKYWIDLLK
jgi:hypothetical protein